MPIPKQQLNILLLIFLISISSLGQTSNLWIALNPNAGSNSQTDEDISINNGTIIQNYGSNTIQCTQTTVNNNLVYSITYTGSDLDKDGNNDEVSFNLTIKGYIDATYNYSALENQSSVTNYGTQSDVTVINNTWGVNGDFDVDAGESLTYELENFTINGLSSDFTHNLSLSSASLIEPNGGRDHTMIFGFGTSLESLEIDSNKTTSLLSFNHLFSVTGAGSFVPETREWSIEKITFKIEIEGPNDSVWDVTDYSSFEKGPSMSHDYATETVKKTTLPNFSWNKIPRWVAARSTQAFSDEQITDIANNFQLIMLEKANTQGFTTIEEGIENAATRLKEQNPNLTTLFYYNTRINYFNYAANLEYNENAANWSTYETNSETGEEEIYLFKDLYYWYNHDVEAMRNWWIDTCVAMANLNVIDGVFVDKITNPDTKGNLYDTNGSLANSYVTMLSDLNDRLPENKLLVGNTLRNEREGGARALMGIMDGSYLERWNLPSSEQSSNADAIAVSIQLMREALLKGKMITIQTNPEYSTDEEEPTDEAELLDYVKNNVHFPLAVYLIIAEENAYFSYTTGVNALSSSSDVWDTSFIDEFQYYLGEPLGEPTKDGYLYKRSFKNLDVWVNIETKETGFDWKDKTLNPDSTATLDNGNIWYHNYSTNDFIAEYSTSVLGSFDFNQATISTNGNTSDKVSKFTKTSGTHSIVKFKTPNELGNQEKAVFKMKVYTEANTTSTNNNIRVILRKDNDTSTQLSKTVTITKMDSWEDYIFDFSDVTFKTDYYNQINIFFASPDTDNDADGNIYYVDAFQGPIGDTTLTVDEFEFNDNELSLAPNPVNTSFSLSKEIISATIYNTLGQKTTFFSENKTQYDVSDLKNGIYIVSVLLKNGNSQRIKLVKN